MGDFFRPSIRTIELLAQTPSRDDLLGLKIIPLRDTRGVRPPA